MSNNIPEITRQMPKPLSVAKKTTKGKFPKLKIIISIILFYMMQTCIQNTEMYIHTYCTYKVIV